MDRGTIRRHLAGLVEQEWVQRWDVEKGSRVFPCYMPLSAARLMETLLKAGGCVAHPSMPVESMVWFWPEEIVVFEGEDSWSPPDSPEREVPRYVRHKVGAVSGYMVVRRIDEDGDDLTGPENLLVVRSAECRAINPEERREHVRVRPERGVVLVNFPGEDADVALALEQQARDADRPAAAE